MRLDAEMNGLAEERLFGRCILLLLSKTKAQLKRGDQRTLTGMQQIRIHWNKQSRDSSIGAAARFRENKTPASPREQQLFGTLRARVLTRVMIWRRN